MRLSKKGILSLREFYLRVKARKGEKTAIVAVARKMLTISQNKSLDIKLIFNEMGLARCSVNLLFWVVFRVFRT